MNLSNHKIILKEQSEKLFYFCYIGFLPSEYYFDILCKSLTPDNICNCGDCPLYILNKTLKQIYKKTK